MQTYSSWSNIQGGENVKIEGEYDLNDDFADSYSQQYNNVIDFYAAENFLKVREEKSILGINVN